MVGPQVSNELIALLPVDDAAVRRRLQDASMNPVLDRLQFYPKAALNCVTNIYTTNGGLIEAFRNSNTAWEIPLDPTLKNAKNFVFSIGRESSHRGTSDPLTVNINIGRELVDLSTNTYTPLASGEHAVLICDFDDTGALTTVYAVDLDSKNGTVVNGAEIPAGKRVSIIFGRVNPANGRYVPGARLQFGGNDQYELVSTAGLTQRYENEQIPVSFMLIKYEPQQHDEIPQG